MFIRKKLSQLKFGKKGLTVIGNEERLRPKKLKCHKILAAKIKYFT
jgi:hypothetical protein